MPEWSDTAIILSIRPHGEQAALVNVLTKQHGRQAGLVRGGQSRSMRGVLQIGNAVVVTWRARLETHLGTMVTEMATPHASAVLDNPLRLAGLASTCAIIEGCVPEREPCEPVFDATDALISMMTDGDLEEAWLAAYIRWEVAMLGIAGYALDLGRCAVTGERENLAYVSPRTGVAVTRAGAGIHVERLLRLPCFLGGIEPDDENNPDNEKTVEQDLLDGMELTRHFLERRVFGLHHQPLPPSRERLAVLMRRKFFPNPEQE